MIKQGEYAHINHTTTEQTYFADAVRIAAQLWGAAGGLIILNASGHPTVVASCGELPAPADLVQAAIESESLIIDDISLDLRWGELNRGSFAAVPITAGGKSLGVLCVFDPSPHVRCPRSLAALRAMGRQIGSHVKALMGPRTSAQEHKEITEALQRAEAMSAQLSRAVARFENLFEGLPVACMTLDRNGVVMEWNEMSETIYGFTSEEIVGRQILDLIVPIERLGEAKRRLAENVTQGKFTVSQEWQVLRKDGTPIWVMSRTLPLFGDEGRVEGVISINIDITDRKSAEQELIDSRQLVARQKAELQLANTQLEQLASTDSLTELYNRRAFQEFLQGTFAVAQRFRQDLSIILLDVDYFKAYNDEFGHPAGDQALREFAQVLKSSVRACDCVARYGGEEFVVVLPQTPMEGAMVVAEKIRQATEASKFARVPITSSLGVASYTLDIEDRFELVRRADRALYDAKRAGRNQVARFAHELQLAS